MVSHLIVPLSVVGAYGYSRAWPWLVRIDSMEPLLVVVLRTLWQLEHRTWIVLAALCIQDCLIVDVFHFRDIFKDALHVFAQNYCLDAWLNILTLGELRELATL